MRTLLLCVWIGIGFLTPVIPLNAAALAAVPLRIGSIFSEFSGHTITGHLITLPEAPMKEPTVLVFSFTRTAGKDARLWNEHLVKDFPDQVLAYGVIELEAEPKIFRRLAIAGIKSSMPISVQDRTIVLYRNQQLWKQRLAVKDESRAYVVLLDRSGTICWISPGAFSNQTYGSLKVKLATLLKPHA